MQTLAILPSLSDRQYDMVIRRLSHSMTSGTIASVFLGAGTVFQQTRPYEPGDSVRLMDWKATARSEVPQIKQFEKSAQTPVFFVIDRSASMSRGTQIVSKYATAALICGGLAYAALRESNPVSIMASDQSACPPPLASHQKVSRRVHDLRYFDPNQRARLGAAMERVRDALSRRSCVVVLSDFHDECCVRPLKSIAALHECHAIQLRDPVESHGVRGAFMRLRPAEGGATRLGIGPQAAPSSYQVKHSLQSAGIFLHTIYTERPFDPQIQAMLKKAALRPCR